MTKRKVARTPKLVGIQVGADAESLGAVQAAVMAVLNSDNDQETKRHALDVIRGACSVTGTVLSGNTVSMGQGTAGVTLGSR